MSPLLRRSALALLCLGCLVLTIWTPWAWLWAAVCLGLVLLGL